MSFRELLNRLKLSIPQYAKKVPDYVKSISDYIFELVSRALMIGACYALIYSACITNDIRPGNYLYIIYILIFVYLISFIARAVSPLIEFGNCVCSRYDKLNKSLPRTVLCTAIVLTLCIILVLIWCIIDFIGDIILAILKIILVVPEKPNCLS